MPRTERDTEKLVLCSKCKHPSEIHTDLGCGYRMIDSESKQGPKGTKVCSCLKFQSK